MLCMLCLHKTRIQPLLFFNLLRCCSSKLEELYLGNCEVMGAGKGTKSSFPNVIRKEALCCVGNTVTSEAQQSFYLDPQNVVFIMAESGFL